MPFLIRTCRVNRRRDWDQVTSDAASFSGISPGGYEYRIDLELVGVGGNLESEEMDVLRMGERSGVPITICSASRVGSRVGSDSADDELRTKLRESDKLVNKLRQQLVSLEKERDAARAEVRAAMAEVRFLKSDKGPAFSDGTLAAAAAESYLDLVRIDADDFARRIGMIVPPIGVALDSGKVGDPIRVSVGGVPRVEQGRVEQGDIESREYLVKQGDLASLANAIDPVPGVRVEAISPKGEPEVKYPAEGVALQAGDGRSVISVRVGKWTIGAVPVGAGILPRKTVYLDVVGKDEYVSDATGMRIQPGSIFCCASPWSIPKRGAPVKKAVEGRFGAIEFDEEDD